ncbi:hypothetical protein H5410_045478 [Solanum commersonii]|uniref:Mutator-like transposase n=1 Tax=Solanum commersonii TaxID=4109 RepID=A0A9J5XCV3_SOLCO|nr:hypothetical protein H5410_045478 [Solanum commersonii]
MTVERNILYDDFVNLVMEKCGYNCQLKDLVLPFKITYQPSLIVYLGGAKRPPILRVYMDENPIEEDHNLEEDQQDMLNDEFDDMDMNNHDAGIGKDDVPNFESHNPPIPIVGSNIPYSSQSSRKYFENRFPNGKGPFTKYMSNQLRAELGCKVSYWKIYKGMEHAKSNVRRTHEHGYAVLNAYRYMLEVANPGSKTALSLDENGSFKYFFVSYAAWITGFQEMRKVIAVDGTFLRSKYEGVLLSVVAQNVENHIFPVGMNLPHQSNTYWVETLRRTSLSSLEMQIKNQVV